MKTETEVMKLRNFYLHVIETCPKGCAKKDKRGGVCWVCDSAKKYAFALGWVLKESRQQKRRPAILDLLEETMDA